MNLRWLGKFTLRSDTNDFCSSCAARASHVTTLNSKGARGVQSDHVSGRRTGNVRGAALMLLVGNWGRERESTSK